jgi:hypothetical protein
MSEHPTPPILSLICKGSDKFPRYVIAKGDLLRNPVYWNAEQSQWHKDESKATIFADVNQVLWEHHSLMMESLEGSPCHKYVAPLYLELYGEKPDLDQFREWLERALRIVVNTPNYGYGPDGAVGVIIADFNQLKERKP